MKKSNKCPNCGAKVTWSPYRKDPRTGRTLWARDYGFRAWRFCDC